MATLRIDRAGVAAAALDLRFSYEYLLDALDVMTSRDIILGCGAPGCPAVLRSADPDSDFAYVVMPMPEEA